MANIPQARKAPRFLPQAPAPPSVSTTTSGSAETYSQSSRDTSDYPPRQEPKTYRRSRLSRGHQASSDSELSFHAEQPRNEPKTHRRSRLPGEYQASSDSEASPPASQPRQTRRSRQRSPARTRRRGSSKYRPPYVRDANSGGSDVAAASRSPSRERMGYFSDEVAEGAANEAVRRKVSFGQNQVRTISRDSFGTTTTDGESSVRSRVGRKRDGEAYGQYGYTGERYGN